MDKEQERQQSLRRTRLRQDEANDRRLRAASFAARWQGKGESEVGDKASFWDELLADVFGVQNPRSSGFIEYEKNVESPTVQGKIDGYIASTRVIIEQKSSKHSLNDRTLHGGKRKTPFQQAWDYGTALNERPNWIVACNFKEFWIWDTRHLDQDYTVVTLEKLSKQWEDLTFLVDASVTAITRREELSVDAGHLVDALYDKLKLCYPVEERESDATAQALNVLCVRLVFCFYAESARLFGKRNIFRDYLGLYSSEVRTTADFEYLRVSLLELFRALDKTEDERAADKELRHLDRIKDFPYVNGGLFTAESDIPVFSNDVVAALESCERFNWEGINPTIFGAVFESTLKAKVRRSGGMHYTSIENIHKVIRPLFLNGLEEKLSVIKAHNVADEREKQLASFIEELGKLTFLDPACGSGNFLTESYIQLCRLEGEAVEAIMETAVAPSLVYEGPSIDHFYGIEVDDFASRVAKTAMWIADCQMKRKLRAITHGGAATFPITAEAHIFKGNALRLDWSTMKGAAEPLKSQPHKGGDTGQLVFSFGGDESLEQLEAMQRKIEEAKQKLLQQKESPPPAPHYRYDYIMGNPPFVGSSMMTAEQKNDAVAVFGKGRLVNSIDYVGAWYHKAAAFIQGANTRCALVSTNSITQGEQVAALWDKLLNKYKVHIDFAYRTFKWQSESTDMAAVHCVIVGFSVAASDKPKVIYEGGKATEASNINPYLLDAPNVVIASRGSPLCDVPKLTMGNKPTDDGNFILTEEQKAKLIKGNPKLECCIRRYVGARDFLNNNEVRYCLWLKGISPSVYKSNKEIHQRLEAIKAFREKSTAAPTRASAKTAYQFFSHPQTEENFLIIPRVSSERRYYIPIAFMPPSVIAADSCSIVCGATLYHFGVLTSSVHMAWMRAVCGRLKSDYRYSGGVVYNNFVWPTANDQQRERISQTAQAILDARAQFPDSSLADLYDDTVMPKELRHAHTVNDRAVLAAYGWGADMAESDIVARLMEMYQQVAGG